MGTNIYFTTKNKKDIRQYFGANEEWNIWEEPELMYAIHVCKISYGWLPLFQAYEKVNSVNDYREAYKHGHFKIYDEYHREYDWMTFYDEFVNWNGGTVDGRQPVKIDAYERELDPDFPEYGPVSHFEYANGKYADGCFKDDEGYEFDTRWFC